MNKRTFLVAALLLPVAGVAQAAVPSSFDYARGTLEQGVVLDDLTAGTYYYNGPEYKPPLSEWLMMRSDDGKTWHKVEYDGEATDSVDR